MGPSHVDQVVHTHTFNILCCVIQDESFEESLTRERVCYGGRPPNMEGSKKQPSTRNYSEADTGGGPTPQHAAASHAVQVSLVSQDLTQQCIFLKSGSWKKWGRERNVNMLWRVDQSLLCCDFDSDSNSEAFVLRPNAEALFLFAWPSPLSSSSCGLAGSGWEGLVSICKCN